MSTEFVLKAGILKLGLVALFLLPAAKCSPQETKAAVKVADDACHEVVSEGLAPEWVKLACDAGTTVVSVIMPRKEWIDIKARRPGASYDVGPGK